MIIGWWSRQRVSWRHFARGERNQFLAQLFVFASKWYHLEDQHFSFISWKSCNPLACHSHRSILWPRRSQFLPCHHRPGIQVRLPLLIPPHLAPFTSVSTWRSPDFRKIQGSGRIVRAAKDASCLFARGDSSGKPRLATGGLILSVLRWRSASMCVLATPSSFRTPIA